MRAVLEKKQSDLEGLVRSTKDSRAPVELDQTTQGRLSRMDAMQQQAMAVETARRREMELKRIESALGRMAEGDYGFCVVCDEPIELKRLELDPAIPTCLDCAGG